jgi:uncharacterized protein
MTLELNPVGVKCNLSCPYCYETSMRDAGNFEVEYDMAKMKAAIEAYKQPFSLFGGEALLVPIDDLEQIFKWSYEMYGSGGIQTNGSLITARHIEIFTKYNVHIGLSLDGPDELNDSRWAGSLEKTRKTTEASFKAIDMLEAAGRIRNTSIIVTLHRGNASPERLPKLIAWFKALDQRGLRAARLHLLELDNNVEGSMGLSTDECFQALLQLFTLEMTMATLRFDMFKDMVDMLRGQDDKATCIWRGCDPYTTSAVQGVDSQGNKTNCGRTTKDGVNFLKASVVSHERQLALYHAPQESGGCNGCRFFLMCRGECPGMAGEGDWRNKTTNCEVLKRVFGFLERFMAQAGVEALSLHPRRQELETLILKEWENGVEHVSLSRSMRTLKMTLNPLHTEAFSDEHGHTDGYTHTDDAFPIRTVYTPTKK